MNGRYSIHLLSARNNNFLILPDRKKILKSFSAGFVSLDANPY